MDGEMGVGEESATFEVLDGRAQTAVVHGALGFQPVEHRSPAVHEHFELRLGFGHVGGGPQALATGDVGREPEQGGRRGVGRVGESPKSPDSRIQGAKGPQRLNQGLRFRPLRTPSFR